MANEALLRKVHNIWIITTFKIVISANVITISGSFSTWAKCDVSFWFIQLYQTISMFVIKLHWTPSYVLYRVIFKHIIHIFFFLF